ncbi:carbonic anhydrase, partial [Thermomonas sp.]|uniref:carbonic anhydrase n=1 Tax=Thermomonas sp. TaxID=1971895 RepID=UPI002620302A
VDVLEVRHVLVTGHYGCGGVGAALSGSRIGLSDNWIRHVRDVAQKHEALLQGIADDQRNDAMCELNAIEQARNVCLSTVLSDAWTRGQSLAVHGWVYSLHDGKIRELGMDVHGPDELESVYDRAIAGVRARRMPTG